MRIYRAISREALKNDKLIIVIAKDYKKIVGFNITVIDWKKFWYKFMHTYPLIAIELILKRTLVKIKAIFKKKSKINNNEMIKEFLAKGPSNQSWNESSPQIAKTIYTGVHVNYRKKGIGKNISTYRNRLLIDRGINRLDTMMNPANMAIIKMNYHLGYKIYREGGMLFGTKVL